MMSMKPFFKMRSVVALLLSVSFAAAQILAQKPAPMPAVATTPPSQSQQVETNVSFDTLVSVDSYRVYAEVRSIGQQVRSGGLMEVLEPVRLAQGAPKDFKTLIDFLTANADALLGARLYLVTAPVRSGIPDTFFALELSSPDEAMKFEPKLRTFLPAVLPSPAQTPAVQAETNRSSAQGKETKRAYTPTKPQAKREAQARTETQALPFALKRRGNLLLMSAAGFTFKSLLPDGSKPLSEDGSFHQVRDRFANDAVFVYYNVALQSQLTAQLEKEAAQRREAEENTVTVVADPQLAEANVPLATSTPSPTPLMSEKDEELATVEAETAEPADEAMTGAELSRESATSNTNEPTVVVQNPPRQEDEQEAAARQAQMMLLPALMDGLFRAPVKWPDAVGIGAALNGEALVVRALIVTENGTQVVPIPFLSSLISGPQQAPESPSVLPADTELFVTASLDLSQMYDAALGLKRDESAAGVPKTREERSRDSALALQIALFEKSHGFKIKEDFLATLGNEVAVALPLDWFSALTMGTRTTKKADAPKPGMVFLISLKDKEAFRALLPKVMDAFGIKELAAVAQTQKIEDAEIVNYGVVTVAYINNFLVVSPEPETIRRVVEAYTKHETLASNNSYRLATSWQPRQSLGQIYVSKILMEGYKETLNNPIILSDEESRQFLSRFDSESEPLTYSLTSDGLGQLHELHIPRNLILMAIAQATLSTKPAIMNQSTAVATLRMIAQAESNYKEEKGKGNLATLDELIKERSVPKYMIENRGYKYEVTINGDKFTANALPVNYGKEAILSFHLDESGVIHAGDHRGQPATTDDPVVK